MSDTIPPIPPPFGDNIGNPSSHIRAGNPTDTINNTTTTSVVQNVDSDFDIEEDQRSSSEFIADLNAVFHERALLANQRRFYKRSGRVGSSKKPMDMSNETCFADGGDDATVEKIRKMANWDNDDYVCKVLILNGMSDSLFDIYHNVESSKERWDSLEGKYMAEDASSKKFLVSNFINYKMTDSRLVLEQYNELLGILGRFTQHKMNMDEAIQVSCIIDKLPPSWKDFKHTLKHLKEELILVELGSHLRIKKSLKVQDSDNSQRHTVFICPSVVIWADPNKKLLEMWQIMVTLKEIAKVLMLATKPIWVDSGATVHVCKDRCWFKTYESLNDGSILYMGNKSTALVHGCGCVDLRLNIVNDNIASAFMSTSKMNDLILWHARLGHHATPSLENKKYLVTFIDDALRFRYVYLLHTKDELLDKFKVFKTEVELQQGSLIKRFKTGRGVERLARVLWEISQLKTPIHTQADMQKIGRAV
ncbi:zinc finger, CCHC-type containing protein [Tanacetum coccineum]|uniref:Zinc finger, CCHC-type containing protein n=1 Tax=Tanacetum coccineum TaxID=301880 RepID=A0ABQ5HS37_9ASTR